MNLFGRTIFVFLLSISALSSTFSQASKDPKKGKEPSPIGWGVNIGNIRFYNNAFEFGLAPNIAYKLGETVSVGFMMKLDYYYQRFPADDLKFSAFDLGPTVFTRWKPLLNMDGATPFLQGLFLQAEYEKAFIAREAYDQAGRLKLNADQTRILAERTDEDYLYVGIGAASGYPFSTFVSLHYNVIDNSDLSRIPFNYRLGFTYNY